jgi:signal transduction histidine kinase
MLHKSSDNLLNYIDGLLELAKLNKGDVNLQIKTHDINQVIDEALRTSELSALRKNITIIKKQNEKIIAEIDKAKIVMILNNLISNAIKFSHPNSTIEIVVRKDFDNFSIHVIDDGLGVPEEEKENIFSEYQKVHSFGTGGEKGNGLGLAICKQLVELHGGKIGVKSKDNSGSEFFFTLPMI